MPFNSSLWARLDVEIQRGIVECTIIVPVLCQPIKRLVGLKKSLGLEVLEQEVHFCTTSLLGRASEGTGDSRWPAKKVSRVSRQKVWEEGVDYLSLMADHSAIS